MKKLIALAFAAVAFTAYAAPMVSAGNDIEAKPVSATKPLLQNVAREEVEICAFPCVGGGV